LDIPASNTTLLLTIGHFAPAWNGGYAWQVVFCFTLAQILRRLTCATVQVVCTEIHAKSAVISSLMSGLTTHNQWAWFPGKTVGTAFRIGLGPVQKLSTRNFSAGKDCKERVPCTQPLARRVPLTIHTLNPYV